MKVERARGGTGRGEAVRRRVRRRGRALASADRRAVDRRADDDDDAAAADGDDDGDGLVGRGIGGGGVRYISHVHVDPAAARGGGGPAWRGEMWAWLL